MYSINQPPLLPQTQNAIQKYGIYGERLSHKWEKEKNYLCAVDLFTVLTNNAQLASKYPGLQNKLTGLINPQDILRVQRLIDSISEDEPIVAISPKNSKANLDSVEYSDSQLIPIRSTVDLYFALRDRHAKNLIVPEHWLSTSDLDLIKPLSELIERGVNIRFGMFLPEMLATRMFCGKNFTEYFNEETVPDWWEKAFFGSKIKEIKRVDLIALVRQRLASHSLPENLWDDFILRMENYQLEGLLHKDAYYLGWLDPTACHWTLNTYKDLCEIIESPEKVKSLTISAQYGFTPLLSKTCIGLRGLKLGRVKADLSTFAKFIHLEDLTFSFFGKQGSLQELPVLPKLKTLRIENGSLYQDDFEKICEQPYLEVIELHACRLPDNINLSSLLKVTKLKTLSLSENIYSSPVQEIKKNLFLLANGGVLLRK